MKAEEWKSVEERLRVKQRERGGRVRGRKRERKVQKEMEEEIQALEHPLHVKDNVCKYCTHDSLCVLYSPSSFIQQSVFQ